MNIWSLDKQHTIKHLLLRLEEHFGNGAFYLVEPQDTNTQSVRIAPSDNTMAIYIYAYGQSLGHFGIHLEFTDTAESVLEESYDDLSFTRLVEVISLYL